MENTNTAGTLSALKSKLNIGLFVGAFVVTLLVAFLVFRSFTPVQTASASRRVFLKEGYDFRQMHELNKDLAQPEFGSRLALADLQTSKQQKLSSLIRSELLLLVVVDSACAPCESSKDIMESLRKTAAELKIAYLPMVLREFAGDVETQRYAERLGFETCIEWPTEVPLPKLFDGTGTPTHILTTKDGLVLQMWHGTSVNQETRSRIADQISSDLYLIDHTIKALSFEPSKKSFQGEVRNIYGGTVLGQTLGLRFTGETRSCMRPSPKYLIEARAKVPERHVPVNKPIDDLLCRYGNAPELRSIASVNSHVVIVRDQYVLENNTAHQ